MTALRDYQRSMLATLFGDPGAPPPDGFVAGHVPVAAGLAIYRNNIFVALTEALGDLYPVARQLVGDGFFAYAADGYVRANPPTSPILAEYGGGFAAFLEGFEPARSVPYLGDVARLELARHEALHATDAEPLAPDAFAAIPPARLGNLQLTLHPALRPVRSAYPVDAIWEAHQVDGGPADTTKLPDSGCSVLVGRPRDTVETLALAAGALDFVDRLGTGETLAAAFAATEADWDAENTLAALIRFGAFTEFGLSEETP